MKTTINLLFLLSSIALFGACSNQSSGNEAETTLEAPPSSLVGKRVVIDYTQIKAEIHYINESTLHWKTTTPENEVAEGEEKMYYQPVGDDLFFVSWIEEDGTTVSKTIDLKNKVVYAFMSYSDQTGRGGRGNVFMNGKLMSVEE